ncbi:MAG TPA: aldo/keto reductase [Syntrophales bacterium]|nr:aldo/keto reductase [Syntrophales bacterium]HRT71219.1 aldo/keto reductase [Syntrophales bacterium]
MTASPFGTDAGTDAILVLGTAQLGLPYGIANRIGKPRYDSALQIVQAAWESGITEFDTAQAYGNSEEVLGRALKELGFAGRARILSKFEPNLDHGSYRSLTDSLDQTLHRLGIPSIDGMMLHREELLEKWEHGLSTICRNLVRSGRVREIGISVYSPEMALKGLRTDGISLVQIPSNILDRRFERAGILPEATALGKKLYIRSVYLQGLLLMPPAALPPEFLSARPALETLQALSSSWNLTRQEICLGYLRTQMPGARLVIGAETPGQIRDTVAAWRKGIPDELAEQIRTLYSHVEEDLLNPHLWPLRRQTMINPSRDGELNP